MVLAAALYPYVYLLARAAFREQSGGAYEVARALGQRTGRAVPAGRAAAGAPGHRGGRGASLMMETVNDFGVVDYFAVQTLTTGIFSTWLSGQQRRRRGADRLRDPGAGPGFGLGRADQPAQPALLHRHSRHVRPVVPIELAGPGAWLATGLCLVPFAAGFVLPVAVIASHALDTPGGWLSPGLGRALLHTLAVAGTAAVLTVAAALFLVYGVRLSGRVLPRLLLPATTIGYAAPGAVLAVGILIPMAAFDNALADAVAGLTGYDPGLLVTGTAAAIVIAYCVRFFGIAQGAIDSAFGRVSPSLPMAARSLGRTAGETLRAVYLPLMRGSVGTALLLVFVDGVKELPATLLLRPFNFDDAGDAGAGKGEPGEPWRRLAGGAAGDAGRACGGGAARPCQPRGGAAGLRDLRNGPRASISGTVPL